jgi:hypothetical protein
MMTGKIDKGCSILNATDETANPYGLILSEREREIINNGLNRLDNMTNALLYGKTGRKQQVQATFSTIAEFVGVVLAAIVLRNFSNVSTTSTFIVGVAFIILQKLNLLLTHERIDDTHARRNREDEKEAKKRAQYFKDMGCKDMSLEE